jgi:hypothetical protein
MPFGTKSWRLGALRDILKYRCYSSERGREEVEGNLVQLLSDISAK